MNFYKAVLLVLLGLISFALAASDGLRAAIDATISQIRSHNPKYKVFVDRLGVMLQKDLQKSQASNVRDTIVRTDEFFSNAFERYEIPEALETELVSMVIASIWRHFARSGSTLFAKLDSFYQLAEPRPDSSETYRLIFYQLLEITARLAFDNPSNPERVLVKRIYLFFLQEFAHCSLDEQKTFANILRILTNQIFQITPEQVEIWVNEEDPLLTRKSIFSAYAQEPIPKRARIGEAQTTESAPEEVNDSENATSKKELISDDGDYEKEEEQIEEEEKDDDDNDVEYYDDGSDDGNTDGYSDLLDDPRAYLRILNVNNTSQRTQALVNLTGVYKREIEKDFAKALKRFVKEFPEFIFHIFIK